VKKLLALNKNIKKKSLLYMKAIRNHLNRLLVPPLGLSGNKGNPTLALERVAN
jgi:hypothetical protein